MVRIPKKNFAASSAPIMQKKGIGFHPFRWIGQMFRLLKFLIIFAILGAMTVLLAALGLVNIPFVSAFVYHPPTPTRIVQPSGVGSSIDEQFSLLDGEVDITLTEEELTAMMRQKGGSSDDQVVLTNQTLEYRSRVGPGGRMLMNFIAEMGAERGVRVNVLAMHIGSVSVPPMFQTLFATSMLTASFGTQWLLVNTVTDVDIQEGELRLSRKIL